MVAFIVAYIMGHFALSRASLSMVRRDWAIADAFLYLPVRPDYVADHEMPWLYVHHALRCFFYPIWKIDNSLFGGPWPMESMPLRSLSR